MSQIQLEDSWKKALTAEFDKDYFKALTTFITEEYRTHTIYPRGSRIFAALDACHLEEVKVVILGQDPYHGPGQANGLCFSVYEGIKHPPSLRNIFTEMSADLGVRIPESGDLGHWAQQGVLLLNSMLTVRAGEAGSHQGKGWEQFTDAVIQQVDKECEHVVFMLWGAYAQKKGFFIDKERHHIIASPHPSPLSAHRGFFGSRPFSRTNSYLKKQSK
ncbi:MAG: uracil-DNA glycosylase, partial [Flavobacteriales bacterium]|nr:uracil-DNA glycosylase [Flavobacteriales bacterium]